jgi:hypothetical protein
VSEQESDDEGEMQDLSVPMWVWTVLGFALVVAVVIIVIIWGGAKRGGMQDPSEVIDESAETQPAETQPADMEPAGTQPA